MAQIIAGGTKPDSGGNVEVITQTQTTTWTQLQGKPYIAVSSKGIVNGLSNIPNDGADFGPDTTKGATAPGQYGAPYTQTSGIQETVNYLSTLWQVFQGSAMPTLHLLNQRYSIYADIVFPPVVGAPIPTWSIVGMGRFNSEITFESGCKYGLDFSGLQPYNGSGANITIKGLTLRANTSGMYSHINAQLPSGSGNNEFSAYDIQIAGSSTYGIAISNIQLVTCDLFDNAMSSSAGWMTFGGVIETITLLRQSSFGVIGVNCSSLNYFRFNSIFSDTAILFNQPVQTVELEGENHNQITYQGAANVKFIRLRNYTFISSTVSSPFYVNTGYQPVVEVDGFYYNIPSGTVPFYQLGSSGVNPVMSSIKNVFNIGTGTITMPPTSITLPANPPVSGTVYQNTNPYDIEIDLPVYATTAGTAGYVTIAKGASSSSLTTIGNQFVNGSTSSTSVDIIKLRVPAGWYYEFTASGVTFGTASVFAE